MIERRKWNVQLSCINDYGIDCAHRIKITFIIDNPRQLSQTERLVHLAKLIAHMCQINHISVMYRLYFLLNKQNDDLNRKIYVLKLLRIEIIKICFCEDTLCWKYELVYIKVYANFYTHLIFINNIHEHTYINIFPISYLTK